MGTLIFFVDKDKNVNRITRLHLEDDAGKLTHVPKGTLCDYNRSGTPLMEIVTEPDLNSPLEASAFSVKLKIMRYVILPAIWKRDDAF